MTTGCPRCRAPLPDRANFCASCGLDLRAPAPVAPPPSPPGPRCWHCGGMYFHFFPNGRATCYHCKAIYGWMYGPYGHVILMPNPGSL